MTHKGPRIEIGSISGPQEVEIHVGDRKITTTALNRAQTASLKAALESEKGLKRVLAAAGVADTPAARQKVLDLATDLMAQYGFTREQYTALAEAVEGKVMLEQMTTDPKLSLKAAGQITRRSAPTVGGALFGEDLKAAISDLASNLFKASPGEVIEAEVVEDKEKK